MTRTLVNMLAEDKRLITYRPRLNEITGRVTATILLQQVLFRAQQIDYQPFYKFRAPCSHALYREGDSWTEELGFTVREFDTALGTIGTKVRKGNNKSEALEGTSVQNLVIYWTDANRVTWYLLNVGLLEQMLEKLYANCASSNYQVNPHPASTRKVPKAQLPISETTIEDIERVVGVLTNYGVSKGVATELAVTTSLESIEEWIQYIEAARGIADGAAFLVSKLRVGEKPPAKKKKDHKAKYLTGKYRDIYEH